MQGVGEISREQISAIREVVTYHDYHEIEHVKSGHYQTYFYTLAWPLRTLLTDKVDKLIKSRSFHRIGKSTTLI